MKKIYFNRKITQRAKNNLKKNGGGKKLLSKRFGGKLGASVIMENRNVNALSQSKEKKEII
jgi:hypothetical protein